MTTQILAPYRRPISGTEKAWVVADQLFGPFANQLVIDGEGALDAGAWAAAVVEAAAANPGARVAWRGWLSGAAWVDTGVAPAVRVVDGRTWDGLGPDGAPFLRDRLDPVRGPAVEVLLVEGSPHRVIFRTAHAVMDGSGTMAFAQDVIRCLGGQAPLGHRSVRFDRELVGEGPSRPMLPQDAVAPTGRPLPGLDGVTWRRLHIGVAPRRPLGVVAQAIIDATRLHGVGAVRLEFPADLRRDHVDERSTANLSGLVPLDVASGERGADVLLRLRAAVADGAPAEGIRSLDVLRHVPLALARWVARRSARQHARTGRYGSSAILSNLGVIDLALFSAAGWTTTGVCFVPPGTPVTPCFVGLWGSDGELGLCVTMPRSLASDGRLDALVASLGRALS